MTDTKKTVTTVQSVDRALEILIILQEYPNGLGVTELSHRLDVSKSTAHRLLMSLYTKGFVKQDKQNEKYLLGLKLIELGETVSQSLDVRKVASPFLHKLSEETGETVHLVIMEENEIVYIDKIESSATIRMYSKIGKRAPIHCTGVGKAMLAFKSQQEIDNFIKHQTFPAYTEKTITSPQEFKKHLNQIHIQGFAIDDEEHELGIKCAAAPIVNSRGEVIAGVSVSSPIMRMTEERLVDFTNKIVKTAAEISRALGA
ncbi:IclR family transcriptional regulator [Bacillus taeanensis]|uniref:Glycerol operon regulatory protein n=1 Tax=Bacillus taeanensis TaxID=273032 RepID=A0A366Y4J7_9BACI|nr:IclR family transcriptional regulator [Bacillus taeanensis]RBW71121.1 IclR family transcriptional regulator [Bacillus taeanensis]